MVSNTTPCARSKRTGRHHRQSLVRGLSASPASPSRPVSTFAQPPRARIVFASRTHRRRVTREPRARAVHDESAARFNLRSLSPLVRDRVRRRSLSTATRRRVARSSSSTRRRRRWAHTARDSSPVGASTSATAASERARTKRTNARVQTATRATSATSDERRRGART